MEPLQPSSKTKRKKNSGKGTEMPSPFRGSYPLSSKAASGYCHQVRHDKSGTSSLEDLERQMKEAAARLDFEEAARLRDIIRGMK
jgi:excinuclease ABC subunit B